MTAANLSPQTGRQAAEQVMALLAETVRAVDGALPDFLPPASSHTGQLEAALHHTLAGGKRVRPFVVQQAAETFGLAAEAVMPTACGFELVHTATLIHDDLPCIDNADRRRARPASHLVFGEWTALLAADALIIAAFAALATQAQDSRTPPGGVTRIIAEFAHYLGAEGVIGGEAADIAGEELPPDGELVAFIHLHKTAQLFVAAARAGAILAGAQEAQIDLMGEYARHLGLLFQVTDDLLDATGEEESLGKPVGADAAAGKQTYPAALGLAEAQEYADRLANQTLALAQQMPARQEIWRGLVWLVRLRQS